jgi:hypothetical protein
MVSLIPFKLTVTALIQCWLEDSRSIIKHSLPDFKLKRMLKDVLETANA